MKRSKKVNNGLNVNKLFIVLCIGLIVLYIIQIMAYDKKQKSLTETMNDDKEYSLSDKKFRVNPDSNVEGVGSVIYPVNFAEFYEKYTKEDNGNYSRNKIGRKLFALVNEEFNTIYNTSKGKSDEEVTNIFNDNKDIKAISLFNVENYKSINEKYAIIKENNGKFKSCSFDMETYNTDSNYVRCAVQMNYGDNFRIDIKLIIPKEDNSNLLIGYYDQLEKVYYSGYKGTVSIEELQKCINDLCDTQIKDMVSNTKNKSITHIQQYYKVYNDKVKAMKINSFEDLMSVRTETSFSWTTKTKFSYYEVEKLENECTKEYYVFKIKLHNSTNDTVSNLKIALTNIENIEPRIKISGETVFEY